MGARRYNVQMNEIQRQAYLEAMGVTSYFPRFILPGAPVSRACEWPAGHELPFTALRRAPLAETGPAPGSGYQEKHPDQGTAPDSPAVSRALRSREILSDTDSSGTVDSQPGTQGSSNVRPHTAENPGSVRFRLVCIPVNEHLSVVESLPFMGNGQLPASHRRLLSNVLRSLGLTVAAGELDVFPLQWPMLMSSSFDSSIDAAREALHTFLEDRSMAQGPQHLLLWMGSGLAGQLYGNEDLVQGRVRPLPMSGWQLLCTDSLDQMLRVSGLKKNLWQELAPLRQWLESVRHAD